MMLTDLKYGLIGALIIWGHGIAIAREHAVTLVGQGQGLSLEQAMNLAEQESSALKAVASVQEAAEARAQQASDAKGPRLSLEAQRGWIDTDINKLAGKTLPNGIRYPDQINSFGLVLQQPVTGWFVQDQKKHAEQSFARAAAADREVSAQDLRGRVAETFLRVLKSTRLRDIAKQSLNVIQKQKRDAELLKAQGKLAQLDFARFAFAESDAITQLSDMESQLASALVQLREQLNRKGEDSLAIEDVNLRAFEGKEDDVQERAEVKAAQQKVEALSSLKSAAHVDYYPNVSLFARYERDFAAKDIVIPIPGAGIYPKEDYRDRFSYGLSMAWTLWDGMVRGDRDKELTAETQKAQFTKAALESQLRTEEAQVKSELERVQQTLRNAEVSAKLSEEIFSAFHAKFQNGLATTTDILSAERDLTRARAQLASAGYDLCLARIRYKRARGLRI